METINDKIVTFLNPKTIEPAAKQQLENIAELPFVFKHVAVMPDCHLGKGRRSGRSLRRREPSYRQRSELILAAV